MRDITGPHSSHTAVQPLALPRPTKSSRVERFLERINQLGGRFVPVPQTADEALTLPHVGALPPRRLKKTLSHIPRGVATKTGRVIKRTATAAREELKKPGRKTSLIHTVALGALFALVLNGTPWIRKETSSTSASATSETAAPRRYLPSIPTNPKLEPLNASAAIVDSGKQINLYGWVTPWNIGAGSSDLYSAASAFWLTVGGDGVTMIPKADWTQWDQYKLSHALNQTYLTVSGDPNIVYNILTDTNLQSRHIAALLDVVRTHNFDGIDIDYEGLGTPNRDLFTGFVRNLTTIFHQSGKKVAVTLESRIANQVPMDWRAVGALSDEVRIMAYDYHSHETPTPGPIAPLAWVAEIVAYAADHIDPSKIVIGLGNYGYDWTAPSVEGDIWKGVGISYDQAINLSSTNAVPVIHQTGIDDRGYDIGTIPNFAYTDTQGQQHQVWFEDAASLQEKINAVAGYQIKGVMFWSVGAGDPALAQQHS